MHSVGPCYDKHFPTGSRVPESTRHPPLRKPGRHAEHGHAVRSLRCRPCRGRAELLGLQPRGVPGTTRAGRAFRTRASSFGGVLLKLFEETHGNSPILGFDFGRTIAQVNCTVCPPFKFMPIRCLDFETIIGIGVTFCRVSLKFFGFPRDVGEVSRFLVRCLRALRVSVQVACQQCPRGSAQPLARQTRCTPCVDATAATGQAWRK